MARWCPPRGPTHNASRILKSPVRNGFRVFPARTGATHRTNHINIMKDTLASLIRHALTALAGAGTFMAGRGLIAPDDAAAVNASGATVQDALVVVVVAVVLRLLMTFGGKLFAAHMEDGKNGSPAWVLLLGMVGLLGMGLPSCSSSGAVLVRGSYQDDKGNVYAYDPMTGVTVKLIDGPKVERQK